MSGDGKATIVLKTAAPRVGQALEGSLRPTSYPKPGQVFRLELSCSRTVAPREGKAKKQTAFFAQQDVAVVRDAEGSYLPFHFDVPVTAPPSGAGGFKPEGERAIEPYAWQLAFYPADAWIAVPAKLPLELGAAPQEELRAAEALETPEQKAVIEAYAELLAPARGPLLAYEREQLRSLSPEDLAMAKTVAAMPGKIYGTIGKWFLIVFAAMSVLILLMFAVGNALLALK